MNLSARGALAHFGAAVALISVIPSLALFYLRTAAASPEAITSIPWFVVMLAIVVTTSLGYVLLMKYPITIIRLRANLFNIIKGELPDTVDLSADEEDIAYIETALNRLLEMLRKRLVDVQAENTLLEEELFHSQKLESLGTLAGGVAHEINNPIMGIMNYAQLILDELGPDSPACEYSTEIIKETKRVARITTNLLAFARNEKQEKSAKCIHEIVGDSLLLIRTVIRHDQISLEVDVPDDLPKIWCREQQIQQIIMNLLTNARDALNEKYEDSNENKKITIMACPWERGSRKYVRVTVEDHGPGIPEKIRQLMFDPFFTTKAPNKGTGLGLSISHGIIKDHDGMLGVDSLVGEWTRFHVDLPVADLVQCD